MTISHAQSTPLTCPQCAQSFSAEIWLIVDTAERPDLADRCRDGSIHTLTCSHCGHQGQVDAPLLVYQPPAGSEPAGGSSRLLFVPPSQTSEQEDQALARALLALLREHLGSAWDDALLGQFQPVPRPLLAGFMSEDAAEREAARQEMDHAAQAAMDQLRSRDPAAYHRLKREQAAQQAMQNTPLLRELQAFIQARTWAATRRVLADHPELLSDEADDVLSQLIASARESEEGGDTERILTEHRDLLRRCREVGVEQAFAEKVGANGRSPLLQALTALPDDLRTALIEVMASVSSQEELDRALDARPELRAALEKALEEQG